MLQSLRTKTLLAIVLTLCGLLLLLTLAARSILLDSFLSLETKDATQHVERVRNVFADGIIDLERNIKDYAFWDEAYDYMENHNEAFIHSNFIDDTFVTNRWEVALIVDRQGLPLYAQGFDLQSNQPRPLPRAWRSQPFASLKRFTPATTDGVVSGLIMLEEGPFLMAARHIMPTNLDDEPRGLMLTGRFLTEAEIQQFSEKVRVQVNAYPWQESRTFQQSFSQPPTHERPIFVPQGEARLEAWTLLNDIDDRPAVLLRLNLDRNIYLQGKKSFYYILISVCGSGLAFGLVIILLLEKIVLARIFKLSAQVQRIGQTQDLKARVRISGNDEIGTLASSINGMLESHEQLNHLLELEQSKAQRLLLNVLPEAVAERLKENQHTIAESYAEVTILFADIVDFTNIAASNSAERVVSLLNEIFSEFDLLAEKHGLEKIKTIGDAYMVVGGLPQPNPQHAFAVADMALDIMRCLERINRNRPDPIKIRIGINTGSVVAGVIGTKKFLYDLWGDAVNTASRMETSGVTDMIQITEATYMALQDAYEVSCRGPVDVKGKGPMTTYFLLSRKNQTHDVQPMPHLTEVA